MPPPQSKLPAELDSYLVFFNIIQKDGTDWKNKDRDIWYSYIIINESDYHLQQLYPLKTFQRNEFNSVLVISQKEKKNEWLMQNYRSKNRNIATQQKEKSYKSLGI